MSNLFVEDIHPLVGDGTITMKGNVAVTGSLTVTGSLHAKMTDFVVSANNTTFGDAASDVLTFNAATGTLTNGLNFDSNTLVIDSNNNRVGFGLAAPQEKLDVFGNIRIGNGGGGAHLYYNATNLYFNNVSNGIAATIANGKFGIGTSSPNTLLHVDGDVTVGDDLFMGSDAAVINFGATADNITLGHRPSVGLVLTGSGDTTGLMINNTKADGDPFLAFGLSGTQTFTMGIDDGDSDKFKIGTSAIGTNTRLTIDSDGKVGIGTTAPTKTLGIDGDLHFQPTAITTAHITTAGSLKIRADNSLDIGDDGADSVKIGRTNTTAAKVYLRSGTANDLVVFNKKVGIGTETPTIGSTIGLDIENATASSATEGAALRLSSNDGAAMAVGHRLGVIEFAGQEGSAITVGARIEALCDAAWTASENGTDLLFYTTDGNAAQSEHMRIRAAGNVGIGVSDADTKLEVLSTSTQLKLSYDADSFATLAVADGSGLTIASGETGDIVLDPGGANVLPGSDSADSLGASGTAWANLYVDAIDLNGQGSISIGGTGRIDLDADDDTSIRASADDKITIEVGGADELHIDASAIYPNVNGGLDLGTSTYRFANVYTGDLHLANDRGDWTVIEEEDYLSIRNNKSGKMYKFVLQEISEE